MKSDWRRFADNMTDLAKSEGQRSFYPKVFDFVNAFVSVESCAIFKIAADKQTGAQHLATFGNLEPGLANFLARDYVRDGFKNDPMAQTALTSSNVKVRHIPGSKYAPEYRSRYFEKAGLSDKVTSIHNRRDIIFLVNFYRAKGDGTFSPTEFRDLERLAPIVGRFVLRHVQLIDALKNKQSLDDKIETVLNDNTRIFSRLSPKERRVGLYILQGLDETRIAEMLSLAKNTVITYRRRLYTKLEIASKADLFRLMLDAFHREQ